MAKRSVWATGVYAGAASCFLFLACSNSNSAPPTPDAGSAGSAAPPGTAPFDETLVGCAPTEPGCYATSNGGAYAAPASTATCGSPGGAAAGAVDAHCGSGPYQAVDPAACGVTDAGDSGGDSGGDAGATADGGATDDAGSAPVPGECGENSADYGATMYGSEADDDDCKYHVSYTTSPICENDGVYFVVTATYLTNNMPLTGACTFAELCLNDTHVIPASDSRPPSGKQTVVEGPPGTYTLGPVQFDEAGKWTVRFHFNELCCDIADSSPHGHAAFFVNVP